MVRQRPPDYLPRQVLTREDFVVACGSRDLGRMLEIAIYRPLRTLSCSSLPGSWYINLVSDLGAGLG
jgi:hypothetical protein